jgi:DNA transformation protein and related proteins
MANSADFIAHVLELMRPATRATARAMFGGHGVYADGIIVAIVVDDTVYFKTDDDNRGEFAALGMEPFEYATRDGARQVMSYHRAPDEALESPAAMAHWLRSAMGAALRRANARPAPRKTAPRKTGRTRGA